MKKALILATAIGLLAFTSTAPAQNTQTVYVTNNSYINLDLGTNGMPFLSGPVTKVFEFLGQGSNYMIAPYGIVTSAGKCGGGIAVGYKVSEFVVPMLRADYLDGTLFMPSASLQLQAPITLTGKFTTIPFAFAGIATPLAGKGIDNGTAVGIFGAGMAARVSTHCDIVFDVEKWSGFSGQQYRFGVLYKF
jgi:hypothetical protein